MPTSFRAATSALLLTAALAAQEPVREVLFFDREDVLGTSFRLGVDAEGFSAAEEVQTAALAEIARLDALLSGWKADSELRRAMSAAAPTKVSPELLAVLQACDFWRAESGGVFHPAIGGLTDLWRAAEKSGAAPTAAALAAAVAALPAAPWTLDPRGRNRRVRAGRARRGRRSREGSRARRRREAAGD
jgi:thiamine biosynthesis lipoprotein